MSMSSVGISPVSIRPAASRAQIRAQIWFVSCGFLRLSAARPIMPVIAAELDADAIVTSLAGRQIPAATGRPNTILAVDDATVVAGTTRSPDGELVPIRPAMAGVSTRISSPP